MGEDGGAGDNSADTGEQAVKGGDRPFDPATGRFKPVKNLGNEVRAKARALYFDYAPKSTICKELGISPTALDNWISRGRWYKQRETFSKDLTTEILKRRGFAMANITNQSFEALSKAIAGVAAKKSVTLHEGQMIATILASMDKVVRLAQGEPTDRVEHTGNVGLQAIAFKTEKEIREALAKDPMTDVIELIPDHAAKIGPTPGQRELAGLEDETRADRAKEIRADAKIAKDNEPVVYKTRWINGKKGQVD